MSVWTARVLTIFPEMFPGPLGHSLAGRALHDGLWNLACIDIRDFAADRHGTVDDAPFGGGPGMVMRADVLDAALDSVADAAGPVVYLTPRGRPFDQDAAARLAAGPGATLLCGRFEGIDERIVEARDFAEISVGDFVLSGGEPAAIALIDACVRLLPVHSYTRMLIESLLSFESRHEYIIVRQKESDDYPSAKTLVVPRGKAWPGQASYRLFVEVPGKLSALRPDLVIETAHFGPWNLPASVKRVTVIHDLSAIRYPQYHRWHGSILQRLFLKGILKRSDLILANSRFTAEDIARWEPGFAAKTTAIHPGRDPFYEPVPRESIPPRI